MVIFGPRFMASEPHSVRRLVSRWFPVASHLTIRLDIPYPVWLGALYIVLSLVIAAAARLLVRYLRAPSALAERRRVLGGSLLHALLDVAYQAQIMADDPDLAASRAARSHLHQHVLLAAAIAAEQWVKALEIGSREADRIIRDQGHAIATAILRWERDTALGGALLPALSQAFSTAVVNAADCDWKHSAQTRRTWCVHGASA